MKPVAHCVRRCSLMCLIGGGMGLALGGVTAESWGQVLLDPASQPRFVNHLPNPLNPGHVLLPDTVTYPGFEYYEVSITQFDQHLGLIDPITETPLMTTVWGYHGVYPGPTIVAYSTLDDGDKDHDDEGLPVRVWWRNELVDDLGNPLPHLLPVDTSLHWANPPGWPASGVPLVTHVHGGHSESASDGLPEAWFTPGFAYTGPDFVKEVYQYDNDQEAATIWYHDHALGITRLNVYAGLAGFYIVRDENELWLQEHNFLPEYPYEVPIAIQDRLFTADGQLHYPSEPEVAGSPDPSVHAEMFGDIMIVNGQAWPVLEVEPRKYRFRLLNGSDSRFYHLSMEVDKEEDPLLNLMVISGFDPTGICECPPFIQIGSDGGFLNAPVELRNILLSPGERADVLVDFSNPDLWGQTIILRNTAPTPYPDGDPVDPETAGQIMAFRVMVPKSDIPDTHFPASLRKYDIEPLEATAPARELVLTEGIDEYGRLKPMLGTSADGPLEWAEPITETPYVDETEIWSIINTTPDTHPVHLHLVFFQVLDRQAFDTAAYIPGQPDTLHLLGEPMPPADNEQGWKDTVRANPGEVIRVIACFDRLGLYVWHCHILSHEDHEMMRPFLVLPSEDDDDDCDTLVGGGGIVRN